MESRPQPSPEKKKKPVFTTLKSFKKKRNAGSLPRVHVPFNIKPNKLTRDNSKFLYQVIQK